MAPSLGDPFALDLDKYLGHLGVDRVAALGAAHDAGAGFLGTVGARDIAKVFEAAEQLVHRLLAHTRALGEGAGAHPIRSWILQHRDMRQAQLVIARRVELLDQAAMDRLCRHAQQRTDQHVLVEGQMSGGIGH